MNDAQRRLIEKATNEARERAIAAGPLPRPADRAEQATLAFEFHRSFMRKAKRERETGKAESYSRSELAAGYSFAHRQWAKLYDDLYDIEHGRLDATAEEITILEGELSHYRWMQDTITHMLTKGHDPRTVPPNDRRT